MPVSGGLRYGPEEGFWDGGIGQGGRPFVFGRAPRSQPPIGGLVVDPREVKTNPSLTKFLRERISAAIVGTLVAIGILRPRLANGELGPRHWKGLFAFLGVIFAVIVVWTSVHIVQPGNVAVPVTFGHAGEPLDPGIHITLPFTNAYSMSTRTQNYTMSALAGDGPAGSVDSAVTVLGSDGGSGTVNATLLYRVDRSKATDVYRSLGRNYGPAFVRPVARGCIRDAFTKYGIVDGASTKSAADPAEHRGLREGEAGVGRTAPPVVPAAERHAQLECAVSRRQEGAGAADAVPAGVRRGDRAASRPRSGGSRRRR